MEGNTISTFFYGEDRQENVKWGLDKKPDEAERRLL